MAAPDASSKAAPSRRPSFLHWGWIELPVLVVVAILSARYSVARVTPHEEVRVETVNGPLAHLNAQAVSEAAPSRPYGRWAMLRSTGGPESFRHSEEPTSAQTFL